MSEAVLLAQLREKEAEKNAILDAINSAEVSNKKPVKGCDNSH